MQLGFLGMFLAYILGWILLNIFSKSPTALPIIGHLHLLGKCPHISLMNLARRYGPCMFLKLGHYPSLVISSGQVAREALKTHDITFSSRPALAPSKVFGYNGCGILWAPYGESWRNVRKLCSLQLLTSRRIELTRALRAHEMCMAMRSLEEYARNQIPVNIRSVLKDLTHNIVLKKTMGFNHIIDSRIKELIEEAFVVSGDVFIGDYIPWLRVFDIKRLAYMKSLFKKIDEYLQKQIEEHRNRKEQDESFISIMLENCDSDTVIKAVLLDVIGGGTDTTSVTVEWALSELIKNPDVMRKTQEELVRVVGKHSQVNEGHLERLSYLQAVVKEALRLHAPAPLLLYETTQECKLINCLIPARTRVFINIYAMARDETVWEEPLKFKPERFIEKNIDIRGHDFEMLPFGAGRRGCPGIQLGLTMVQYILASLVHTFDWDMPNAGKHEELDMSEEMVLTLPRASPLILVPSIAYN